MAQLQPQLAYLLSYPTWDIFPSHIDIELPSNKLFASKHQPVFYDLLLYYCYQSHSPLATAFIFPGPHMNCVFSFIIGHCLLSQSKLNLNSTQMLSLTWKWLLFTTHQELNVSNISAVTDSILMKCEHLEQIPTVRVTFVHATFVLATYVHIRNISAVTDMILMKL